MVGPAVIGQPIQPEWVASQEDPEALIRLAQRDEEQEQDYDRDIAWVYSNVNRRDMTPDDAPSGAAWKIYHLAQVSPQPFFDRYSKWLAAVKAAAEKKRGTEEEEQAHVLVSAALNRLEKSVQSDVSRLIREALLTATEVAEETLRELGWEKSESVFSEVLEPCQTLLADLDPAAAV